MCNCGGCYRCLIEQRKVPAFCPECGKEHRGEPSNFPYCSEACEDAAQTAFHMEVTENAGEAVNER
jgi:hypothetical protein